MTHYEICAIIPTYNNAATVCDIVLRTAYYIPDIIVVVDGATDDTRRRLHSLKIPLTIVDYPTNKGKGYALKQGFKKAIEIGYTHALTIDSDGQHLPEDIPALLNESVCNPNSFIVGSRSLKMSGQPKKSSFANRLSNFWFRVQTTVSLSDTQSGMRIYPLTHTHGLSLLTNRYEAELTILVFAVWANETIISVPIRVYYPPKDERVSHFRPLWDFLRISVLNTFLTIGALLFGLPHKYWHLLYKRALMLFSLLFVFPSAFASVSKMGSTLEKDRLLVFPAPQSNNTHTAVVVCPGGSYSWLSMKTEGTLVAQWLQSLGISAFVLRYRVASVSAYVLGYRVLGIGNKYPNMLIDAQDALQYVYTHHSDYGVDTNKIGVMGFSAGGHLAFMSYLYNKTPYKPKFICSIYPVITMREKKISHVRSRRGALGVWGQFKSILRDSLSLENHIKPSCPPVFLVHCLDDPTVNYRNSELMDSALLANRIPHLYLPYKTGGHGFGVDSTKTTKEAIQWKEQFVYWVNSLFHVL